MKDPSAAMQTAIHAKLVGSSDLATAMGGAVRAYDKPPADPTYPYIRIGDDQPVGDSNGCADAWEFYATLHIFGRHATAPRPEVKAISNAALAAICTFGSLPAPAGFTVVDAELQQARTYFEADGVTVHGVITVRYLVNDNA